MYSAELAAVFAQKLFDAGEARVGTDEDEFVKIFTSHSTLQLQEIAAVYASTHENSLELAVEVSSFIYLFINCSNIIYVFFLYHY